MKWLETKLSELVAAEGSYQPLENPPKRQINERSASDDIHRMP